jgi:hypothetical protein
LVDLIHEKFYEFAAAVADSAFSKASRTFVTT